MAMQHATDYGACLTIAWQTTDIAPRKALTAPAELLQPCGLAECKRQWWDAVSLRLALQRAPCACHSLQMAYMLHLPPARVQVMLSHSVPHRILNNTSVGGHTRQNIHRV